MDKWVISTSLRAIGNERKGQYRAKDIKAIADRLIGTKRVKHGKLSLTTGKYLK